MKEVEEHRGPLCSWEGITIIIKMSHRREWSVDFMQVLSN
jgi:hypothetical protein